MKRLGLISLWLAATSATTVVAYFAVNIADAEVTNRPLSTVASDSGAFGIITTTGSATPRGPFTSTSSDTNGGLGSTTSAPGIGNIGPSTSTTSPTSTTLSRPWQKTTITSAGGW